MAFNPNTPRLPSLPRLGGNGIGNGGRSRRDLEEEERRRRMTGGAGGLGGLGPAGGARPPMQKRPQQSAMFEQAGGLPSVPRPMTPTDGFYEDEPPTLPDEPMLPPGSYGGGIVDEGYEDSGPVTEDEDVLTDEWREGEGTGGDDWVGGTLEQLPDPSTYLEADDPSELDALFEDIIEGLESDIPEVRQNAMNEMNAALRRQAEINSIAGRGIGGGFGGAMGATTARGMEALARSEMDARNRVRQAQLSWLDRRLRQQGIEDTDEREMRMAVLDMLKDVDEETLMERYGKTDLGQIIDDIMEGGGLGSGTGAETGGSGMDEYVSDGRIYSRTGYQDHGSAGSIDGQEVSGSPAAGGFDWTWGDSTLTASDRGPILDEMANLLEEAGIIEWDSVDGAESQYGGPGAYLDRVLMGPTQNEVGMEMLGFIFKYQESRGRFPTGVELWDHIRRMHMDGSLEDALNAGDMEDDSWLGGEDED